MSKRERDRDRELKLKTESQNQTPSTACFTLATAKERDSIFYGNVDGWFIMTFVSFRFVSDGLIWAFITIYMPI